MAKKLLTLESLITRALYESRKDRRSHPEGDTDNAGRWHPSAREDAGGDGSSTRTPTRAWPWSYMDRCRTRQHCAVLVARLLTGQDVPSDVIHVARVATGLVPPIVSTCAA